MKKAVRISFGGGVVSRILVLGLMAVSVFVGSSNDVEIISQTAMAASPDVSVNYCAPDSPARDLTLFVGDLNIGVPLPNRFSNGTNQPVTFTTTMKTNRFFGSERVVDRRTVGPDVEQIVSHLLIGVDETTPLGTDTVVIEVTSNATGTAVLGRCTFKLKVTRRTEQRDVIGIPLRLCFLEGTALAFDPESRKPIIPGQLAPAGNVIRLIDQVNDQTWLKYAKIVFRTAVSPGVPVIKDPDMRPTLSGTATRPGEVDVPVFGDPERGEPGLVKTACELAWQNIDPSQKGIVVVFVGRFLNAGNTLGFVPAPKVDLVQSDARLPANSSTRLCEHPRQRLLVGDVTKVGWSLLLEPNALIPTNNFAKTVNTLAHELGHALLLAHGNGLDDNGDGALPPQPGPRRYDENCDTKGIGMRRIPEEDELTPFVSCEATESLMHFHGIDQTCFILRPLQVEQARAAAKLVPGRAFDASADPAGTLISELPDPNSTETPADVLIASVEIAETPELAIMEISQTVVGALPETPHNRYTTLVDLDNDPATGCNPADLGLPTTFGGAELVTNVLFEAAGGQSPQLSPTVWRCEAGGFIPLSAVDIEARASDVKLTDIELTSSGRFLGRIEVLIPSGLVGPHSGVIRVQAFAEQLGAGGKMNRVPVSPDAGGLISLPAPVLPSCSVSAPVVNPGSVTQVRAEGLLPGQTVAVLLGGDPVGTGVVDGVGVADVELPIPRTSLPGLRPVTVQVRDTLSLATCEVEVIGNAVTPVH